MSAPAVLPEDLWPRTTFWAAAAPLLLTTDAATLARRQVDGLVDLLGLAPGDHVADLQCASNGQVAIELARRGMRVTAVAFNPAMGELVTQRAAAAGVDLRVVAGSDPTWADQLDDLAAAVDIGSPFGVVDALDDAEVHLSRAIGGLAPDGALAVLTMGAEVALRDYVGRDWYQQGDRLVLFEAEPTDQWTRLEHRWRIYEADGHSDLAFTHRLLTGRQVTTLLEQAGLDSCALYGTGVDGTIGPHPYDQDAGRLLAVGRR